MSGIGFELRKLFSDRDSAFFNIKGLVSSVAVTVGPWVMTAVSLNLIMIISRSLKLSKADETLFTSSIFYIFIFSQILTLTFQYFISKYISNCIAEKKLYKIRSMFLGKTKLITIISFIMSYLFIRRSSLSANFKAIYIFLFVLMSLSWLNLIFISVLKKYRIVVLSYIAGITASLVSGYLFLYNSALKKEMATLMLLAFTIGAFINFTVTSIYILRAFSGKSKNQFEFLNYVKGNVSLIFIGLFYVLAVWGHVFANWITGESYVIGNVFLISPLYESSIFYSYCTVIPSIVYFSVFLETRFLPLYEDCRKKIFHLEEKEESIERVKKMLRDEILKCMELQFFISLSSLLLGNLLFNYLKISTYNLNLFYIMVFASFAMVFISILVNLFLYFNLKMLVLVITGVLMILNFLFSMIFGSMGVKYTGLGFFVSAFLIYLIVLTIFLKVFEQLVYIMNFGENMKSVGGRPLKRLSFLLDKKIYIVVALIFLLLSLSLSASSYDKNGFKAKTRNNWHTMSKYDVEGYDIDGYDKEEVNRRGFNKKHWNVYTDSKYDEGGFDYKELHRDTKTKYDPYKFDVNHVNRDTGTLYNERGFDYRKINRETRTEYDTEGWNIDAVHEQTGTKYNPEGWNIEGINQRNFNRQGYNIKTKTMYDEHDFDIDGNHKVTKKPYDERRFDINQINIDTKTHYDRYGFDYRALHKDTGTRYDKNGWDYNGINAETKTRYNKEGYNREGKDKDGYRKGERPVVKPKVKPITVPPKKTSGKSGSEHKVARTQIKTPVRTTRIIQSKTVSKPSKEIHTKATTKPSKEIQTKNVTAPYDRHGFDKNGVYIKGGW